MLKASIAVKLSESEPLFKGLTEKGRRALKIDGEVMDGIIYCTVAAAKNIQYKEMLVRNRIFEMLCLIAGEFDFTRQKQETETGASDVRLFKAKQFIKDNESLFPSCEELAQYCNISVKQLNRIFVKYEGLPLLKYVHNAKISQAKKMLTAYNLSPREISESLGFSSVYYFCKFFTARVGVSPGAFKKMNKTQNPLAN